MNNKFPSLFSIQGFLAHLVVGIVARITFGRLPPVPSVAAIVELNNCLLLVSRKDGSGYCLPGGIMRWNETIKMTLIREVFEETGYIIEVIEFFNNYSGPERDKRFSSLCLVYKGKYLSGHLAASLEGDPEWVPLSDLSSLSYAFDHKLVVQELLLN